MSENITLISKDGEHQIELPTDDPAEITNLRAQGWATAEDREATAAAESEAAAQAPAPAEDEDSEPAGRDYSKLLKADLEAEVTSRNEGRADDARIEVGGNGTVPDLVAALQADDAAAAGGGQ